MDGTQDNIVFGGAGAVLATPESDTPPPPPRPYNRLAPTHKDCFCYLDVRCQLAVAVQEARDYWTRHPDDADNAPNEIHQSIDQWLVECRILDSPAPAIYAEPSSELDEPSAEESPVKRAAFKFPRIRPINLGRRLSLPGTGDSSFSLPLLSPRRPERRHTDGEDCTRVDETTAAGAPMSPRRLLRSATGMFRSARRKGSRDSAQSGETTTVFEDERDAWDESVSSGEPPVSDVSGSICPELPLQPVSGFEHATERAEGGYEAPLDSLPRSDTSAGEQSTGDVGMYHTTPTHAGDVKTEQTPQQTAANSGLDLDSPEETDPAHVALAPIFYELEALTENPRHLAIAASHGDADYALFWETFADLSARDILLAAYAIRAGVLDEPTLEGPGPLSSAVVAVLVIWALSASALAIYLFFSLP